MRNLVIVEASGKVEPIRLALRAIGIQADVMATAGQIADNPASLRPIELNDQLRETKYAYKADRQALLDKIGRAAAQAETVYLAMDDDDEGDVIAHDLACHLTDCKSKLCRVRLRSISELELRKAFSGDLSRDFNTPANNGICRRIVDRAIGATFTSGMGQADAIPVGRVQSSLLAAIDAESPQMGEFSFSARFDGREYHCTLPVYSLADIEACQILAANAERAVIVSMQTAKLAAGVPWRYEDVVAEVAARLKIDIVQASDAFQEAYIKGRVSYPRTRATEFTQDAVEVMLSIAAENRCAVDAGLVPVRGDAEGERPHEAPRPLDAYMLLGRPLSVLEADEVIAVLIARNAIACGQKETRTELVAEIAARRVVMTRVDEAPRRNWKDSPGQPGYRQFPADIAILKFMAKHGLGRPSTIVSHVDRFVRRGLLVDDGSSYGLNEEGMRWLARAREVGFTPSTASEIEAELSGPCDNAAERAKVILARHGMLDEVMNVVRDHSKPVPEQRYDLVGP